MASVCGNCETLPTWPSVGGQLFLWPPLGHSLGKAESALRRAPEVAAVRVEGACLIAEVPSGEFASVMEHCAQALTAAEQRDTRCLVKAGEGPPGLADFGAVTVLSQMVGLSRSQWLLDILGRGRLTAHFQPIVARAAPDRAVAQECLLRWLDDAGQPQSPAALFAAAADAALLFQLDRAARETAVRTAARKGVAEDIFINFTPTAIYDPRNCLRTTMQIIQEVGLSRDRVVFEVIETERIDDVRHLASILDYYRDNGFRVALDDLGAGYASLNLLGDLRPDIVKIDHGLIRQVDADTVKAAIVTRLIDLAHDLKIEVVAEGIETPSEAAWLTRAGVGYMQGYHFARPAETPRSRLGPA